MLRHSAYSAVRACYADCVLLPLEGSVWCQHDPQKARHVSYTQPSVQAMQKDMLSVMGKFAEQYKRARYIGSLCEPSKKFASQPPLELDSAASFA